MYPRKTLRVPFWFLIDLFRETIRSRLYLHMDLKDSQNIFVPRTEFDAAQGHGEERSFFNSLLAAKLYTYN
jgi:hypothetical protein